jgi:hypothetical protein
MCFICLDYASVLGDIVTSELTRRKFALATVGLASLAAGATNAAPKNQQKLNIAVPEDVFVDFIAQSGSVKSGDVIARLKSWSLQHAQNHAAILREHISISERPFLDGRVDEEIALLSVKLSNLKKTVDTTTALLASEQEQFKLGMNKIHDVDDALNSLDKANNDYLDADIAVKQASRKKQEALDKIALAKKKLDFIDTLNAARAGALTLTAVTAGTFTTEVGVGSFVQKGHHVGSITS